MRVCGCGCGASLEGRRATAVYLNDAHRERVKRRRGGATGKIGRRRDRPYEEQDGCWVWLLAKNVGGYGLVTRDGKTRIAHRWYYEQEHGPVPEGYELHHVCGRRDCVNPAHARAVTRLEHVRIHDEVRDQEAADLAQQWWPARYLGDLTTAEWERVYAGLDEL